MADHGGGGEDTGNHWFGITIEVIVVIAILAVVVFGLKQPFNPTYLNIDFIFGKMLIALQAIVSFFVDYSVGSVIKIFIGLLVVALIALNFWLFLRLLEMEDEHEEHVYHHAEEHIKPRSLFKEVLNDFGELANDTTGFVTNTVRSGMPRRDEEGDTSSTLDKLLYLDEADTLDHTADTPDATYKHEVDEKEGSSKWRMVLKHSASKNPSDWKLAIIEADTILDALVERSGFPGETLGERLKNADRGVFRTLDFAWDAHKIRNRIAHEGLNFVLTERDARKVIQEYEEVFKEFSYI